VALPVVVETPEDRAAAQERSEALSSVLSGITDRANKQVSAAGTIGDTLRYIMHRLSATIDHLDGQEPDYIGDALLEMRDELLSEAIKTLGESGRSVDIYDDGSPVEIIFRGKRPGVLASFIRRPSEPLVPEWIADVVEGEGEQ
jgi:hypothetical protein